MLVSCAACWAASSARRCACSSCGPAMKNCQPNSTTTLSTIAMIMLRLFSDCISSSFGRGLWGWHRQLGNQTVERHAQCLAAADEHVVMLGLEASFASFHGSTKTAPDAIALRRIAGLLGDRKADAGLGDVAVVGLQRKRRAPDAAAPGDSHEFRSLLEASQIDLLRHGRDRAEASGRQLLAADGAAAGEDDAAILGRHTGAEAVTAGANEHARLESTFRHTI